MILDTAIQRPGTNIMIRRGIHPREEGKTMGIIGFVLLAVGFGWIAEALLGFKIEGYAYAYPFSDEVRYLTGIALFVSGVIIEWLLARRIRHHHRHV